MKRRTRPERQAQAPKKGNPTGVIEVELSEGEVEALKKLGGRVQQALARVGELSIQEEMIRAQRLQAIQTVAELDRQLRQRLLDRAEAEGYSGGSVAYDPDRKVLVVR